MEKHTSLLHVGCAGWSVPAACADQFSTVGSHLQRYATRFPAVEINSSFYRPHRPQTYQKWAAMVPDSFRFAVKMPKTVTHEQRLKDAAEPLHLFLDEARCLGPKLGPLLVQLPPSLAFEASVAGAFFQGLRAEFKDEVVCEPRHASWFSAVADGLLREYEIARVAADPALVPPAKLPGGWNGLHYYRLHGSPRVYYSAYSPEYLASLAGAVREAIDRNIPVWCIFDNTAEGAATGNALDLIRLLQ